MFNVVVRATRDMYSSVQDTVPGLDSERVDKWQEGLLYLLFLAYALFMIWEGRDLRSQARLLPWIVSAVAAVLVGSKLIVLADLGGITRFTDKLKNKALTSTAQTSDAERSAVRTVLIVGWIGLFFAFIYSLGFIYGIPLFLATYMAIHGEDLKDMIIVTVGTYGFIYLLFVVILNTRRFDGILLP